jgi:hypothetical protein
MTRQLIIRYLSGNTLRTIGLGKAKYTIGFRVKKANPGPEPMETSSSSSLLAGSSTHTQKNPLDL